MSQCSHSKLTSTGKCCFCGEQVGMEEAFSLSDNEVDESDLDQLKSDLSSVKKNARNRISKKHDLKVDFLFSFLHLHSQKNLDVIMQAIGGEKSSQGTMVVWVDSKDAPNIVFFSGSSAAIKEYIAEKYDTYEYLCDLRSIYGDEHHIHAEMHLLADHLHRYGRCKGDGVIVSKPCCPVCADVLKAFGVEVLDDGRGGGLKSEYSTAWRNPWSRWEKTELTLKYRKLASEAAQKHGDSVKLYGCE